MLFLPLGSTEDIGASALYVNLDGTGLLLDAGQDPNVDGVEGLPRLERIKNHPDWALDHVILTHAHHDHIGIGTLLGFGGRQALDQFIDRCGEG